MSAFGCKPANLESTQWEALCFNGDISNRKLAHETTKKRQKGDFLRGGGVHNTTFARAREASVCKLCSSKEVSDFLMFPTNSNAS